MRAAREAVDSAVRRIRRTPGYEDFLERPRSTLLAETVRPDTPIAYLNITPWGSLTLLLSRRTGVMVMPLWSSFTEADMNDLLHRSGSEDSIFPMMAGYLRLLYNLVESPQPLWFATRELSEIALLFDQATCLYGEDATKDRLLEAARSASHVHLACHGAVPFAGRDVPYLELAGGERFTVDEIARRRPFPAARMVVLSACQSALVGSFQLADEVMGLPTAVMLSGTPGVIGTLWAVNDLPTSLLMERFYSSLLGRDGPALEPWDALRKAQRWLSELTGVDVRRLLAADPALRRLAEENWSRTPGVRSIVATLGQLNDPGSRPFADAFYWAPFVYVGE